MPYGLPDKTIKSLKDVLAVFPEVEEAVIFGSRATGTHKPGSDIDLALKGKRINQKRLTCIETQIDELMLPYKVDILHYENIESVKLRVRIDDVGQQLYYNEILPKTKNKSWIQKQLGDVFELKYGKALPDSERKNSGKYPVFGANGIVAKTDKFLYSYPSIIVGRKGSAGELNFVDVPFWPLDVTYYLTTDFSKYDIKFLLYLLTTLNLPTLARGVKPGINRDLIYSITVKLPSSLRDQRRIVSILDTALADLAHAKANAEKNLSKAREIFAAELNEVFSTKNGKWIEYRLVEVSEFFGRGRSRHRPRNDQSLYNGKYPFIQTGDIRNSRHIISTYSQTYNDKGLAQSKLWPKGTVCITIAANIAETGVLDFEACFPDSVIGLIPNHNIADSCFIEYLLQYYKNVLQKKGKGSAQDNINLATFENIKFPFPLVSDQKRITASLDQISTHCEKLFNLYEKKISLCDELKKSLLYQAFNGELQEISC